MTNAIVLGLLLEGGIILSNDGWEMDVHVPRLVFCSQTKGSWIITMPDLFIYSSYSLAIVTIMAAY